MPKIDFKNALKVLYQPSPAIPVVVIVPQMKFVMVDGKGDPNTSQEYQEAVESLFAVSYALKFMLKKQDYDYVVMPLEGLWWVDGEEFSLDKKDKFCWTSMVMQPDRVTEDMFHKAVIQVAEKKNPPAIDRIRFESFHEGKSVQILHVGPYDDEPSTIEKIHQYARKYGYRLRGKHHEIYLSDPNRVEISKLKTVLRQPVEK